MPGFLVLHYLPRPLNQRCHQPSHPRLSPSSPAFNLSQHQSLFPWVGSWNQVAKVLELQLQHQSFQWIFKVDSSSLAPVPYYVSHWLKQTGGSWGSRKIAWVMHSGEVNFWELKWVKWRVGEVSREANKDEPEIRVRPSRSPKDAWAFTYNQSHIFLTLLWFTQPWFHPTESKAQ